MILEVSWDGLRTLSFELSQFHGHGSWLVCEVALRLVDFGVSLVLDPWKRTQIPRRHGWGHNMELTCRRPLTYTVNTTRHKPVKIFLKAGFGGAGLGLKPQTLIPRLGSEEWTRVFGNEFDALEIDSNVETLA